MSIDGLLEPHTFRTASALTIVSEPLAEDLRNRYPSTAVHSIPNAFSEREWIGVPFAEPKRATFLHPGQLYEGGRDPRPFFETLAELLKSGTIARSEIAVELYGRQGEWLTNAISRLGLDDVVRVHGNAPREQILRLERAATRLLVFLADGPHESGTYTGKLFEYLGARRKIIAMGGPPKMVLDEVLEQTGAGQRFQDSDGLRHAIVEAVQEWRAGRSSTVEASAVAPFESAYLAKRFADVLDEVVNARSDSRYRSIMHRLSATVLGGAIIVRLFIAQAHSQENAALSKARGSQEVNLTRTTYALRTQNQNYLLSAFAIAGDGSNGADNTVQPGVALWNQATGTAVESSQVNQPPNGNYTTARSDHDAPSMVRTSDGAYLLMYGAASTYAANRPPESWACPSGFCQPFKFAPASGSFYRQGLSRFAGIFASDHGIIGGFGCDDRRRDRH